MKGVYPMEQSPTLSSLLFNIIHEITSPDKANKLNASQAIGILFLTNLLGIANYLNHQAQHVPMPVAAEGSSEQDLIGKLMQMALNRRGAGSDVNLQNLGLLLNLLSSLGSPKRSADREDSQDQGDNLL